MRPEKIQSAARTCPDTRTPFRLHRLGIVKRPLKIQNVPREEVQRVAEDVYIYGYPLLLMDVMRRMHTAVSFPRFPSAPVNHYAHGRLLPGPHSKDVVRPHADMLCSSAWLDLSKEPVVLSIPRTDRYYLLSIWSAWYEIFEAISPRNTGPEGGSFVFVGPQWSGRLPDDLKMVQAPTETVWIDGRFQAAGVEDIQVVHRMQDHFRLVPLTQWGKPPSSHSIPFRLDVDQAGTPEEQVARYDAPAFYKRLAGLMLKNPAQACDAVIGDHDRLRLNSDNSLSISIQHEWPGTNREFNWLPAPKDSFNLVVRMYWPKPDVFSGRWRPPAVTRMN